MTLSIILLIVFLLLSAFFSAAETSFTSLSDIQISLIKSKYPIRGKCVSLLFKNPQLLLGCILIGNNTANFIFSVQSTKITLLLFGDQALAIVTGIMIFLILVFGEITPKQLALKFNQQYLLLVIFPLVVFYYICIPFTYILSFISNIFYRRLSKDPNSLFMAELSREHFINFFYQARKSGALQSDNVRRLTRIFSITDYTVEKILTHRTDVVSISSSASIESALAIVHTHSHKYYPVYHKDEKEYIIGIVSATDMHYHHNPQQFVAEIMHEAFFTVENTIISDALMMFRKKDLPLIIVLDEYGGLNGIVSLEDVLSFLFDQSLPSDKFALAGNASEGDSVSDGETNNDSSGIIKISHDKYKIKGTADIDSISELVGIPLDTSIESHTIGGYIQEHTGSMPLLGISITTPLGFFTITNIADNRIESMIWIPKKSPH